MLLITVLLVITSEVKKLCVYVYEINSKQCNKKGQSLISILVQKS